jgi:PAS domain S-box-containing protein
MARILVIDDEESILYTFGVFLSAEGHEVLTARDYGEALGRIEGAEVDLVFSDILLGGNTGIDVLGAIKDRGLATPVVMMTGYPSLRTASEALRLGAFDYLTKPVVQDTLLRVANVALRYKRALDEKEEYRAHLDAIFGSIEDAIVTVDGELTVLEANEAAKDLLGIARDAIGGRLDDLEIPCGERVLETLRETLESMRSVRAGRLEHRRAGRPTVVMSLSAYPLRGRQGRFLGAVVVARDETRLAALEHELGERGGFHGLVGKSEAMRKVYSLIESLASVETTVLITGESGTGKELVAEALHRHGSRSAGTLVKVNCAALPESLLESELFGHVKGAFTGAIGDRIGRFQRADGGTIFLDEIGEISPKVQMSLLRVLQEKEIERVGESSSIGVDVRVIAATNRDLREKVERGEFREDLFYRLTVVKIPLPPLRDRREDVPLLVAHFLEVFNGKFQREIKALSSDVEAVFLAYPWPGNVRELEHAMEHAFILCRQDTICLEHLPPHIGGAWRPEPGAPSRKGGVDATAIRLALHKTAWNKAKAARLLRVDRKTLYRKMAEYGIIEEISE